MHNGLSLANGFKYSSGSKVAPFSRVLGSINKGQMGPRDCATGLFNSLQSASRIQGSKGHTPHRFLCKRLVRRGRRFITKTFYRTCSGQPLSRVLFKLLPCSKEDRRSPANTQPETDKRVNRKSILQDGNSCFCGKRHHARRLDGLGGFERRIFPCAHSFGPQKVPQVLYPRQMLPIQGSSLRSDYSSKGVHKGFSSSHGIVTPPRRQVVSLPGRHSIDCGVQTSPINAFKHCSFNSVSGRFYYKPCKVISGPLPGHGISRSSSPIKLQSDLSSTRESCSAPDSGKVILSGKVLPSQEVVGSIGSDSFGFTDGKMGSPPHEVHSDIFPSHMEEVQSEHDMSNYGVQTNVRSPPVVDRSPEPTIRFTPIPSRATGCAHDGCLLSRLGRCAGGRKKGGGGSEDSPRSMGHVGGCMAHQHAGTNGSVAIPPALSGSSEGQSCSSPVGQHDNMLLHKQDGRDKVPHSLSNSMQSLALVPGEKHISESSPRSRGGQCPGRFPISTEDRPKGVVPSCTCGEHSIQNVGETPGGFICVRPQQETKQILFMVPFPSGDEQRCFFDQLGSVFSGLHIPSDSSVAKGTAENKERESKGNSDSAEVACQTVVSNDPGNASRDPSPVARSEGSVVSVQGSPSRTETIQLSGMEAKRRRLGGRGFSKKVVTTMSGARAPSTIICYESRWRAFTSWCRGRDKNPFETDVVVIADFLQYLFDLGRSWSTIKGYVSAISAFHPEFMHFSLGTDRDIREFVEAVFKKRPPIKTIIPRWELGMVMQALCDGIFEPPERASLQSWTMKTVFLVAITSAARVSELQALDSRPELSRLNRYKATLRLNPAFTPKRACKEYLDREIELEAFYAHPKDHLETALHKLCPVRALRYYLDKTKDIRKDPQLFVSYQAGKQGCKVTKATIARWVKQTILFAYRHLGRQIPVSSVKAHSTRAVAASLADVKGVSPADLCNAATWSSSMVFAKHYRLDMAALRSISSQVLSAAVAHKS